MAAEQGGNCAVTKPGEIYVHNGVTIVGITDFPSRMASQASQLYGTNLCHLLSDMGGSDDYKIDFADEAVRGALITHAGEVTWPAPKPEKPPQPAAVKEASAAVVTPAIEEKSSVETKSSVVQDLVKWIGITAAASLFLTIGLTAPASFLSHFTVFILACFVGWQVIWNVSPSLHTPLMSVTNAISGIIIIGGLLQLEGLSATSVLGAIAILVGTINISGGFLVTQRMLKMFRK